MSKHTSSIGDKTASAPRPGFRGLRALQATNANPAQRYLLVFDADAAPAVGAAPALSFPIPPSSGGSSGQIVRDADFFGDEGMLFERGAAWAVSTSPSTYQPATAADHTVVVAHV